nr:unnamed protein product [Spirometra erinaceieuropaei]
MDQLSLVAEHCAAFGHAFAFQDAEVLGQGSDQTVRETLEAWHTTTTSINRCVTLPAAYQALRVKFNRQGYRRDVRPETTVTKPRPSGNTDGHRQTSGTNETRGQPAANAGRREQSPDVNTGMTTTVNTVTGRFERDGETRTRDSDRNPQPDANTGMTTTVNTVTGRCERDSETRTRDSDRNPQPDVNTGVTTTVHAVTGRRERGRKARYVEGGQRTMQTRAMAAVTPTPPPSPHPTKEEEKPMPP